VTGLRSGFKFLDSPGSSESCGLGSRTGIAQYSDKSAVWFQEPG
jgi:hypothetical protein